MFDDAEPRTLPASDHGCCRPHVVVVAPPACGLVAGLLQALEPVLVETLVAETAVEALDVGVLRRLARLVQDVVDARP